MEKCEFYYPSQDKVTQIHGIEWKPSGEPKAVLQICHGMVEYIDRYKGFAKFLNERGIYVVGHDHLGHGESVVSDDKHGYFHETRGNEYVIADIHELRRKVREEYPDIPYFIMGHSMGSFLVRQYMKEHGEGITGAIIMGTGHQPAALLAAGKMLCKMIAGVKGWEYRSKFINNMAFGSYNKKFEPARTSKDWLTKDTEIVDAYIKDPWCSFMFTVNAYYHMFCGMQTLSKKDHIEHFPKDVPVFFVAGKDDPVGNFGKSVDKIYEKYRRMGIKDVSIKLYEGDRHEILNETDREQVYEDLYEWIIKYC